MRRLSGHAPRYDGRRNAYTAYSICTLVLSTGCACTHALYMDAVHRAVTCCTVPCQTVRRFEPMSVQPPRPIPSHYILSYSFYHPITLYRIISRSTLIPFYLVYFNPLSYYFHHTLPYLIHSISWVPHDMMQCDQPTI